MLTVNIIGAGAVGQTFGYLLVKHNLIVIKAVLNQRLETAIAAIEFMGQGYAVSDMSELPPAHLYLITVPDQQIALVANQLAANPHLPDGALVMHCSGALTSACLYSLHARGCKLASMHPCFSFHNPKGSVADFTSIPCALEGDSAAFAPITELFTAIGAQVYPIAEDKKALYHASAVFASNYLIPLLQQAHDGLLQAGLSTVQAKAVVDKLVYSVAENVKQSTEPKHALTGPIQRADINTVIHHLEALSDPVAREFYQFMANKTLSITNVNELLIMAINQVIV